jgi:hypothetical protein
MGNRFNRRTDAVARWVERLQGAAATGAVLDLAVGQSVDLALSTTWPEACSVPVAAVRAVLTTPGIRIDPRGLRVRAARFEERLDLDYVDFAHPLTFLDCVFERGVTAQGAHLRDLHFVNSALNGRGEDALTLDGARITGAVFACDGFLADGEVRAIGAIIGGQLNLVRAKLQNAGRDALSLDRARIDGGIVARGGFHADGGVRIRSATVGQLDMTGATLRNPGACALTLDDASVSGGVLLQEGFNADGEVRAVGATVDGPIGLTAASLSNPGGHALSLVRARITGHVLARDGFRAVGEVSLHGATIGGQLNFTAASLTNKGGDALFVDNAEVAGGVFAGDGFCASGTVRALGSVIGAQLYLTAATLSEPDGDALLLDGATITGGIVADGLRADGMVRAPSAKVGGQVNFCRATLKNPKGYALVLDDAQISGGLIAFGGFRADGVVCARRVNVSGQVNLSGATIVNPGGDALSLDGARITADFWARQGFHAEGAVAVRGAIIGGQVDMTAATLSNPGGDALSMDLAEVAGGMFAGEGFRAGGAVTANGAIFKGPLDLTHATLINPDGVALSLEKATIFLLRLAFPPHEWVGSISLVQAQIGSLLTGADPPAPLDATGWVISDLHGPLRDNWRLAHNWLSTFKPHSDSASSRLAPWIRRPTVAVQPWYAFADVYDRNGDPASARKLRFTAEKIVTAQSPPVTRMTRMLYGAVAGYGHYPFRAVISMIALLAIATTLVQQFRSDIVLIKPSAPTSQTTMQPWPSPTTITAREPCDQHSQYPCLQPLTFAINSVLPPAAGTNAEWRIGPSASLWLVTTLAAIKLGLWALAALFLAGVTGLLRKAKT